MGFCGGIPQNACKGIEKFRPGGNRPFSTDSAYKSPSKQRSAKTHGGFGVLGGSCGLGVLLPRFFQVVGSYGKNFFEDTNSPSEDLKEPQKTIYKGLIQRRI